jgi:hypothetical protein
MSAECQKPTLRRQRASFGARAGWAFLIWINVPNRDLLLRL